MKSFERILLLISILLYLFLAVFSYSYVDLNLTISQNPLIVNFINSMQRLGYFHRPQATLIYLIFLILTFLLFIFNLWFFYREKVGVRYLKLSVITSTLILIFAYPFLSSDLFNYLFDAKIILNYHVSPYTHKPQDFIGDDWLRFMRWVHRYSPYGPIWLGMSLVPAFLGFGKFILNLLFFKIFIALFHLINAYLIFKILQKINPRMALFGTTFYALNPLFLIEGVANAHNDVVLATFIILSLYFLTISKKQYVYLSLFLGTLVKYIPILNLPWLLIFSKSKIVDSLPKIILLNLMTMLVFTYLFSSFKITVPFVSAGSTQVQFQPWYLFWSLPLIALLPRITLIALSIALLFGASLRYLPFLFYGDWSHPQTVPFMQIVLFAPLAVLISYLLFREILKR